MADENLNWISLQEAQSLMGRCESTARRLIRKHGIRTKKVLVERGQELRVCLQDIHQLLPDESVALEHVPPASQTRVVEQSEFVDDFQSSMKALALSSASQMDVLERLSVRLDSSNHERTDLVETQRQLSDSLANINRASKAQATALLEFGDRLKEQTERSSAPLATAAIICLCLGLLLGAGGVYFLMTKKPLGLDAQVKKVLEAERANWEKELDEKLRQQKADSEDTANSSPLAESDNAGGSKSVDEIKVIELRDDEPLVEKAPKLEQPADEIPEVSKLDGLIVPTPKNGK
jgi:DNA polymerase III gamma/tau subunit